MDRQSGRLDGSLNRNQRGHGSYSLAEKKRLTLKPLEACTVQGEPCLSEPLRGTLHNTRVRAFATNHTLRHAAGKLCGQKRRSQPVSVRDNGRLGTRRILSTTADEWAGDSVTGNLLTRGRRKEHRGSWTTREPRMPGLGNRQKL